MKVTGIAIKVTTQDAVHAANERQLEIVSAKIEVYKAGLTKQLNNEYLRDPELQALDPIWQDLQNLTRERRNLQDALRVQSPGMRPKKRLKARS